MDTIIVPDLETGVKRRDAALLTRETARFTFPAPNTIVRTFVYGPPVMKEYLPDPAGFEKYPCLPARIRYTGDGPFLEIETGEPWCPEGLRPWGRYAKDYAAVHVLVTANSWGAIVTYLQEEPVWWEIGTTGWLQDKAWQLSQQAGDARSETSEVPA